MKNLRMFFTVVFDTPEIGDDNLRKFADVHLKRLAANNPANVFTPLITATTSAYDDYFGSINGEDTKTALQKALAESMNDALDEFTRTVRRREGTIRGEFEKRSAVYTESFPQGLDEYNQATLANVETLMTRFATAAGRHVNALGQAFADRFVAGLGFMMGSARRRVRG
jgi:hypothetical protein